jgi:hypothetical protein
MPLRFDLRSSAVPATTVGPNAHRCQIGEKAVLRPHAVPGVGTLGSLTHPQVAAAAITAGATSQGAVPDVSNARHPGLGNARPA